jgi:uncharacterized protein YukE
MCNECVRMQGEYRAALDRLASAQQALAAYDPGRAQDAFSRLWDESHAALRRLWALREALAQHSAAHQEGAAATCV